MTAIDWTSLRETTRDDLLVQLRAVHPTIDAQRNMWERGWTFCVDWISVDVSDEEAERSDAVQIVLGRLQQAKEQRDVLCQAVGL